MRGQPSAGVEVSQWVSIEAEETVFRCRYGLCGAEPPDLLKLARRVVGKDRLRWAPRDVVGDHGDCFSEDGSWVIRIANDIAERAQFDEVLAHEIGHVWFNRTWSDDGIHVPDRVQEACADAFGRALRMPREALRVIAAEGCSFAALAKRLRVSSVDLFLRFEDLYRSREVWGERDDDLRLVPRASAPPESGVRAPTRARRASSPRLKVSGS